jgi:transcriptional regulator with XRE-family HTH domain
MNPPNSKTLGKQIALLRKAQGLSQEQLAEVSGIPITAIRRCEQSGKIPLDRYLTLASVLNANIQVIQHRNPNPRFKTIEDVIRSNNPSHHGKLPKAGKPLKFKKPMLGGMFDQMTS